MKALYMLGIACAVFAGEKLTPNAHMSIHNTSYKHSAVIQKKRKMHQLHNIDERTLEKIVFSHTNETIQRYTLRHTKLLLVYDVHTQHYMLQINALDGSLIKKENR